MKNKIIILLSAARDLQYVLDIYERYQKSYSISIVCIKLKNIHDYIQALNLSLENLLFCPYDNKFNIKNPIHIIKERKRLHKYFKKNLSNIENAKVFFFNVWFDWVLFAFLNRLRFENSLNFFFYATFMPIKGFYPRRIKDIIYLKIYTFITGNNLLLVNNNNKQVIFFPYYLYNVKIINPELPRQKILAKYSFKIPKSNSKIILFIDDYLADEIINYNEKLLKLLLSIKNIGYEIYVKGHPNWKCEICNKKLFKSIPKHIPMELINIENVYIITGVVTHSFIDLIKRGGKVVSLIELFHFKSEDTKQHYKRILIEQTDNKINFINSIEEIC